MRAVSTGPERRFGLRDRFLLTRLWISKISFSIIFLVFTVLLSSFRSKASKRPLEYISFQLRWTHQALFVGLYLAAMNGYYANKGLNVTFRESGLQHNPVIPVLEGSAQFGSLGADTLVTAQAQGKPVIAIAAIYRRSPAVFISVVEAGITHPQDSPVRPSANPDLVLRFLKATLKGWKSALEHPTGAGEFVKQCNPDADVDLEDKRFTVMSPLINAVEDYISWMEQIEWDDRAKIFHDQNVILSPVDVTQL